MDGDMKLEAFRTLQAEGMGVIDVGARGDVHPIFREVAPLIDMIAVEPDAAEVQRLQAAPKPGPQYRSLRYLPCALGRADGEQVLHLCRSPGVSSFYQPDREVLARFPDADRFEIVSSATVPVRSLDSLLDDRAVRPPHQLDFVKIDTQGSELDILRGATRNLASRIVGVEVEVEFTPLYRSQPVFRDVDAVLSGQGFTLFKLRRQELVRRTFAECAHRTAGQVMFADALYLRDPLNSVTSWHPSAHQMEALILLAMLYDLYDFALELLSAPALASGLAVERLNACVAGRASRLGSLSERLRVMRANLSPGERFRRYPSRWARGDDKFYSSL